MSFRDIKRAARSAEAGRAFAERLRELFEYNPETGELFWKRRAAGSLNSAGYLQVKVDGRIVLVHRVAFAIMSGELPTGEVDHKNRDRAYNAWDNLREATRSQQTMNSGMYSTNTSGFKGVSWNKNRQGWCASITVNGKKHNLGCFSEAKVAGQAYQDAKVNFFGADL